MNRLLILLIASALTAAVGLSVTAEEEAPALTYKSEKLPPPLPEKVVKYREVSAQVSAHGDCKDHGGPGFVKGQPVRNVLRWIFRPRLRRAARRSRRCR